MSMVNADIWIPAPDPLPGSPIASSLLIDASTERVEIVLQAPKMGTLAKVGFSTGLVNTGDTLKISFQDVDLATGRGDSVDDQYRTLVVNDGDDNAWLTSGLITSDGTDGGTKRSVTKGQLVCVRIGFNSWVAGSINIAAMSIAGQEGGVSLVALNGTKQTGARAIVALEYDDGSYAHIPMVFPVIAPQAADYYTILPSTDPDEVGNKVVMPFGARCVGFWWNARTDADIDFVLYDGADNALATYSYDKDFRSVSTYAFGRCLLSSPVTLTKDATYRIAAKATQEVANQRFLYYILGSAALMGALPMGSAAIASVRADLGAWTDLSTRRMLMGLILDQVEVGGAGGMLVHPGMSGGMRG